MTAPALTAERILDVTEDELLLAEAL